MTINLILTGFCIVHHFCHIQCANSARKDVKLNKFLKDVLATENDLKWIENLIHKNPSHGKIHAPLRSHQRQWNAPEENEVPVNSYSNPAWDVSSKQILKWTHSSKTKGHDSPNNYDLPFRYVNVLDTNDGNRRNHGRLYSSKLPFTMNQNPDFEPELPVYPQEYSMPFTFPKHNFRRKQQPLFRARPNSFRHTSRNIPIEYGNNYLYKNFKQKNYFRKRRTTNEEDQTPEVINQVKALYNDVNNGWNEPSPNERSNEPGSMPINAESVINNDIDESKLDLHLPYPKAELLTYINKHNSPIISESNKVDKLNENVKLDSANADAVPHEAGKVSHKIAAIDKDKTDAKEKIGNVAGKENVAHEANVDNNADDNANLFEPLKSIGIRRNNNSALNPGSQSQFQNNLNKRSELGRESRNASVRRSKVSPSAKKRSDANSNFDLREAKNAIEKSTTKSLNHDTNNKMFVEQLPITNEERKKNKFMDSEKYARRSLPETRTNASSNSTGNLRTKRGLYEETEDEPMEGKYGMEEENYGNKRNRVVDTAHVIRIVKNMLRELEERKGERRFSDGGNKASYHKNRKLLSEDSEDQSTFSNVVKETPGVKGNSPSLQNNHQDNLSSKPSDQNNKMKNEENEVTSNAEHAVGNSELRFGRDNKHLGNINAKDNLKGDDHLKTLIESSNTFPTSLIPPGEDKDSATIVNVKDESSRNELLNVAPENSNTETIHNMKNRETTLERKYENSSFHTPSHSEDSLVTGNMEAIADEKNKKLEKKDAKVSIKEGDIGAESVNSDKRDEHTAASEQGDIIGKNSKSEVKRYTKTEDKYDNFQISNLNISQRKADSFMKGTSNIQYEKNKPLYNRTMDPMGTNNFIGRNSDVKFTNERGSLSNISINSKIPHSADFVASNNNADDANLDDSVYVSRRSFLNSKTDRMPQANYKSVLKTSPNEYRDASQMGSTITGNLASKILHDSLKRVNSTTNLKYFLGDALPRYDFDFTFGHGPSEDLYKLEDDNYHQRTQKTLKKICKIIEDLISEEVKKKSCKTLQPDLEDFLMWLLIPEEQQESMYMDQDNFLFNQVENRDKEKKKPCAKPKPPKCDTCNKPHPITCKDIQDAIQKLKNLLRDYNTLPNEEKRKIQKVYQKLKKDLTQLQTFSDKLRRQNASMPIGYEYDYMPEIPEMLDNSKSSEIPDYWSGPIPENSIATSNNFRGNVPWYNPEGQYYFMPDDTMSPDKDSDSKHINKNYNYIPIPTEYPPDSDSKSINENYNYIPIPTESFPDSDSNPINDNYNYIPIPTESVPDSINENYNYIPIPDESVPTPPDEKYQYIYIPENDMSSTENPNVDNYKYVYIPENDMTTENPNVDNYKYVYIPQNDMTSTENPNIDNYKYVAVPENLPPVGNENNNIFVPMPSPDAPVFYETLQSSTYYIDTSAFTTTESCKKGESQARMIQKQLEKLGLYPSNKPSQLHKTSNVHNEIEEQIPNSIEETT